MRAAILNGYHKNGGTLAVLLRIKGCLLSRLTTQHYNLNSFRLELFYCGGYKSMSAYRI